MDLDWFFRIYKNKPRMNDFKNDNQDNNGDKKDEFENFQDFSIYDGFNTMENPFDMYRKVNRAMEKMFLDFTRDSEFFSHSDFKEKSPREAMLRDPNDELPPASIFRNEKPLWFQDTDADNSVTKLDMKWDTDLAARTEDKMFKKISAVGINLRNGAVEEKLVTSDSNGHVTTTVRRSIGDKFHEVITHRHAQGLKETVENITNLDENELEDFNKRWKNPTHFDFAPINPNQSTNQPEISEVPAVQDKPKSIIDYVNPPAGDVSYLNLFKKFFLR